ncbi:hypothetical protein IMSAGC009_03347 [Lachnospiraceae bacterium]|nr:hypothetical protein IMSAGC009_03347 [Lachnospiraceae bacterium]
MVFPGAVKVNDPVVAGSRIYDIFGDLGDFRFVGFYLVKQRKILIAITLVIDIVAYKLHGNGGVAVKGLAVLSIQIRAVDAIGADGKEFSFPAA